MHVTLPNPPRQTQQASDYKTLCELEGEHPTNGNGKPHTVSQFDTVSHRGGSGTQDIQDTQLLIVPQVTQRHTAPAPPPVAEEEDGKPEDPQRAQRRETAEWYAQLIARPWSQFLDDAYTYIRKEFNTGFYDGSRQEWQSPVWKFAWLLRGHSEMGKYRDKPVKAVLLVEGVFASWSRYQKSAGKEPLFGFDADCDCWKEWWNEPMVDARSTFLDAWSKARFTPGQGPLQQAHAEARRMRLLLPDELLEIRPARGKGNRDETDYEFFISIAGHLQVIMGDRNIALPCRAIGELLSVSRMTVSRYRAWGIEDKFLVVAKAHKFRSRGRGDATEFRFDVSLCDVLSRKAQPGTQASFGKCECK